MKCEMRECEGAAVRDRSYCATCSAELQRAHAEWKAAQNDREARMKEQGRCVSCEELFADLEGQSDEEPSHCLECWDEACDAGGHLSRRVVERQIDEAMNRLDDARMA